ncbi:MAG TPA: hypothetical protein DDW50_01755 [Firmicutes bacterium]|jgi:integrase|nr:hypothetical protein [Bacillota bacterium]
MTKNRRGNNEGSIVERKVMKNGKEYTYWMASVTTGYENGKLKRKTYSGKSRGEVAKKMKKALVQVDERTFKDPSKITLEKYLTDWLAGMKCAWAEGVKGPITENTWSAYDTMVRVHIIPNIGNIKLSDLTSKDILGLINKKQNEVKENDKRLSARTVRYIYTTIHKALSDALEEQPPLVAFNAAEGMKKKLPKYDKPEMKTMSITEIGKFLDSVKNYQLNSHHYSPVYAAFYLELHTGLRRGELLGLQDNDINFETREISIKRQLVRGKEGLYLKDPKTKSSKRVITLDERVMSILKQHMDSRAIIKLDRTSLVFCTDEGKPLDPDNFTRHYQTLLDKAGLSHYRFHDLRHSFVTLGLKKKIDYKTLMKFTGHASSKTFFDVYGHSDSEMQEEAAQVYGDLIADCVKK